MIRTCWELGDQPAHDKLNLRRRAHQLGYRGHVATKSRDYSTTYTALRAARAEHLAALNHETQTPAGDTIVTKDWQFSHAGHTLGEEMFAEGIAEDLRAAREAARAARATTRRRRGRQ